MLNIDFYVQCVNDVYVVNVVMLMTKIDMDYIFYNLSLFFGFVLVSFSFLSGCFVGVRGLFQRGGGTFPETRRAFPERRGAFPERRGTFLGETIPRTGIDILNVV